MRNKRPPFLRALSWLPNGPRQLTKQHSFRAWTAHRACGDQLSQRLKMSKLDKRSGGDDEDDLAAVAERLKLQAYPNRPCCFTYAAQSSARVAACALGFP